MLPLSELCRDITMQLPDPLWALSEHERYKAGRSTKDFATWHDDEDGIDRFYVFGALEVPLAYTPGDVFSWGLWIEVEESLHDAYYDAFQTTTAAELRGEGFIANDVPGYPDALGARVALVFHPDRRPTVTPLEGSLQADFAAGLTEERHRALDDALFGDDEEGDENEEADLPNDRS